MPDEQYYALANLVRRPMRRWWARVGSWWMVGLGVLVVSEATLSSFAFPVLLDSSWRNQILVNRPILYQLNEQLVFIVPEISVGLALLCAIYVLGVIDNLTFESLAFSESRLRQYKYRLALINCWPALLPALCYSLVGCVTLTSQQVDKPITAWILLTAFMWIQRSLIWVILLVAFATVTTKTRWPTWAYFLCGLVAPRAIVNFNDGQFPFQSFEFSNLERTVFMVVGLVIIYGVFSLFLTKNYKSANQICLAHCMFLLLAGIKASFSIPLMEKIIRASGHLPRGLKLFEFRYSTIDEPALKMHFGAFMSVYPASQVWAIVPVITAIAWLLAHYFAFSWLMGRDWRKRVK